MLGHNLLHFLQEIDERFPWSSKGESDLHVHVVAMELDSCRFSYEQHLMHVAVIRATLTSATRERNECVSKRTQKASSKLRWVKLHKLRAGKGNRRTCSVSRKAVIIANMFKLTACERNSRWSWQRLVFVNSTHNSTALRRKPDPWKGQFFLIILFFTCYDKQRSKIRIFIYSRPFLLTNLAWYHVFVPSSYVMWQSFL